MSKYIGGVNVDVGLDNVVGTVGAPLITFELVSRSNILQQYGESVDRNVQRELSQLGNEARDMARALAPIDTGSLKASIYSTKPGGKNSVNSFSYFRAIQTSVRRRNIAIALGHPKRYPSVFDPRRRSTRLKLREVGMANYRRQLPLNYGTRRLAAKQFVKQSFRPMLDETTTGINARDIYFIFIGAAVFYAGYVEFGHILRGRWIPPQPFLGPALAWARLQLPGRIKRAIENGY